MLCRNVTVRGVNIDSHGPNNDGCDPESCDGVLIIGCVFSTGDDCIAVKSGRNQDGRRINVPCQNVVIKDCIMKDGHGGVSIGSEVSGGIRNIHIQRCRMSSPHLQRALRIKTNSYRGGVIENISFRDITVGQVAEAAIEVDFYLRGRRRRSFSPYCQKHQCREGHLRKKQTRHLHARLPRRAHYRRHDFRLFF